MWPDLTRIPTHMSRIKSRKHAVSRTTLPAASLTAATLLTSLALGACLPAHAQSTGGPSADEAEQRKPKTLETVEVEGQRVRSYSGELTSPKATQPLVDTTRTVNVIGSDLFTEQGATTLTDVLRNSPGVGTFYVGENGNSSTGDTIYMRGFDSSSSIYVDGVRDLGSISRDVFNIQQVEVAKGPSGADFGRSAPTGSINLASKQATLRQSNSATLSYGSTNQRRLTTDLNTALGTSGAFRINVMAQDSGVPGRDSIKNQRWGIAPSLGFGLDSSTRVYINLLHVNQDNTPDGGVPTIGLPGYSTPDAARPQIGLAPQVDRNNFYGTTSDHDNVAANMATLRVDHDVSDNLRLHNITRWGRTEQDYLLTAFMLSTDPTRFITPNINDPSTWQVGRSLPTFKDQRNTILTNQTNLRAHFGVDGGIEHDLSAGLELIRETLDSQGQAATNGSSWPFANLYNPDPNVSGLTWAHNGTRAHGRTDTAALYAFDTMKLNAHWQLNAGLRVDRYSTDFSSLVICGARGAPVCGSLPAGAIVPGVVANDSDTLLSWNAGVLYKPTEHGSVYANYALSQQPPGGGSLELSASASSANNPIFDPQEARTAEIGTKWNVIGDRLLLSAAVYDTRVENEVVQDPTDLQYYQSGSKRVRGIEVSAVGSITRAWSVSAGFTTMDAKVLKGPAVSNDGTAVLSYTPDKAFTAWTSYAFANGFTIGGGARYSGEMKRGRDGAIGTPAFVEDYWVFDAVASYAINDSVTLRLNANNLFNTNYVAGINKSGYRYTPGAPRNYLLTATFRF